MYKTTTLNARTKVLDAEKGLISAIVSTETPDRDGDIIRVDGWDFTNLLNPPFWKGAPFPANIGRSSRFRYEDFDLHWEAPGKACSFSEFLYEGP